MSIIALLLVAGLAYLLVQRLRGPSGPALPPRPARPATLRPAPVRPAATPLPRVAGRAPTRTASGDAAPESVWVPPGQAVTVQGRQIECGTVYVGQGLTAPRGWGTEHALIDPRLRASAVEPAGPLPYWPSYSEITPAQRGVYLDWLAAGADDPGIDIGYVFLYFYGLERRHFLDEAPAEEKEELRREVVRLLSAYASDGSFRGYAEAFLTAAAPASAGRAYEASPEIRSRWEPEPALKLALGQAVADGVPLSADWALAWLYQDPETSLRTPATRCPAEVRDLFRGRYITAFPQGLVVMPNKTRLRMAYRAASGGFEVDLDVGDLPDVTALRRPLNKLRPLVEGCMADLDAYSRFLGRRPERKGTLEAAGFLPEALAAERLNALDDPFVARVAQWLGDEDRAAIDGGEIIAAWDADQGRRTAAGALRKGDAEALGNALALLGVGIEPDVRRGGDALRADRHAVLFRRDAPEPSDTSEAYRAAELALLLMTAVAHAADDVTDAERDRLLAHVRGGQDLTPAERARLEARLAGLLLDPPTTRSWKASGVGGLSAEARRAAADLALLTALADGQFDPAEARVLGKVYGALGLDPAQIYSDIHALESRADAVPVVRPAQKGAGGRALPRPPAAAGKTPPAPAFALDMDLVRTRLADTQRASALLASVFADEEEDEPPITPVAAGGVIPGLDGTHSALVRALIGQAEWPLAAYEAAAAEQGLMPGGALETINEWAFDHLGDALVEDGDPLLVSLDLWTDSAPDA